MKACKGPCKQTRLLRYFGENRHGNPNGVCKICISERNKRYRRYVLIPRQREEKAMQEQQDKRDKAALKRSRPCSVFQGFLFSGDVA